MSLNMKVWTMVDIALRVPPILLIDAALKYGIRHNTKSAGNANPDLPLPESLNSTDYPWLTIATVEDIGIAIFWFLLYLQVFITGVFVFLFNTKQLVSIYIRLTSIGIIILAYKMNTDFINMAASNKWRYTFERQTIFDVASNYLIQMILAVLFSFTNTISAMPHSAVWLLFLMPTIASTCNLPLSLIKLMPILSTTCCIILLAYSMWMHGLRVCETIYKGVNWCHNVVENYGLYTMLETHWINLHIPQVFRAFWIIRLTEFTLNIHGRRNWSSLSLLGILKEIIINGSENIVALLGMTSIVAYFCQAFGYGIQTYLLVSDPNEKSIGNVSAILFLILSLQIGITSLDPETRYNRIIRNFCLLYTAMMHFIYNILHPILISLSASRNPSLKKHFRALSVTVFLIVTPLCILVYQWTNQETNTWLLAMTSFMIELIIKITVSLLIYMLFIIDAYKNGLWEKLDDYVYYLNASASSVEFILGVYLFLNGLWILAFESTGTIRACMMCLHAYFNIWLQAKNGWESFLMRRSALKKINSLAEATQEQLKQRNDVCAICFQDLNTARITQCNHYFHGVCLRKWLNVQDICPLCHSLLDISKS